MRDAAQAAQEHFAPAIRPIYAVSMQGRHEHVGSCVLLEIDGKRVLLTAAHIFDEPAQFHIGGRTELVPLRGAFQDTELPEGNRERDLYDVAFTELAEGIAEELGSVKFVSENEMVPVGAMSENRLFTVIGYPRSRNKGPWRDGETVRGVIYQYSAGCRRDQSIADGLGVSEDSHLFIDHQKFAYDAAGRRQLPIRLQGLSGGAVIESIDLSRPEVMLGIVRPTPRLAGIPTQRVSRHKVILATRIGPIVNAIRAELSRADR